MTTTHRTKRTGIEIELDPDNDHVIMGRHSNIPDCCIGYFLDRIADDYESREADPVQQAWRNVQKEKGGTFDCYVPCQECLKNPQDMRELHKCGPECGDIYWEREKLERFGMLLDAFLETCHREELFEYAGCEASDMEDVVMAVFNGF